MKCFYCDKDIDLVNGHYAHSVTHGIYMHIPCWEKYESLLSQGKVKHLYDKDELRSLSNNRT